MRYKSGRQHGGLFDYQERKEVLSRRATQLYMLNERIDRELFRLDVEGHLDYWGCPGLMDTLEGVR